MIESLSQHFPAIDEWLFLLLPIFLIAYFSPALVAILRKHRYWMPIGAMNLFLGWTGLGWLASMIWAANSDLRQESEDTTGIDANYFLHEPHLNESLLNEPRLDASHAERHSAHAESVSTTRTGTWQCPFCSEPIQPDATVCLSCGRELGDSVADERAAASMDTEAIERHFAELQALLKDREEAAAQRLAEHRAQPAMNYAAEYEEIPKAREVVPPVAPDVVRELSGWKKAG